MNTEGLRLYQEQLQKLGIDPVESYLKARQEIEKDRPGHQA